MLETKHHRKIPKMASSLAALVVLSACASLLVSTPLAEARVIVRRQAEELVPNRTSSLDVASAVDDRVATTPPRPNDRFEQFPAMAGEEQLSEAEASLSSSDSALFSFSGDSASSLSNDSTAGDSEPASSAAETIEQKDSADDSESLDTTTLQPAPSNEDARERASDSEDVSASGSISAGSGSLESGSGSASSLIESSASDSQLREDDAAAGDDSTEAEAPTTVEPVAINEITTSANSSSPAPPASASVSSETGSSSSTAELQTSGAASSAQMVDAEAQQLLLQQRMDETTVASVEEQTRQEGEEEGEAEAVTTQPGSPSREVDEVASVDADDAGVATTTAVPGDDVDMEVETVKPVATTAIDVQSISSANSSGSRTSEIEQFELSRYTSPSNYSEGGITLADNDTSGTGAGFADAPLGSGAEEEQNTESPITTTSQPEGAASDEVVLDRIRANETVERNISQSREQAEIETNSYEQLVSNNEVIRNQSTDGAAAPRGKKGKFLDQFNEETTEDNDINVPNGAAWALAGMRMVDRKQPGADEPSTAETVADRTDDNLVANNTLKQLMDWAVIMQQADFANSSFIRSTVGTDAVETVPTMDGKDRRTYANKVPNVEGAADVLSEENRLTAAVTEPSEADGSRNGDVVESNVVDTTFAPSTERPVNQREVEREQEMEDFKFEDRSTTSTTTPANEMVGGGNIVATTTRRSYEVSEMVDESEGPKVRMTSEVTTTGAPRIETSTTGSIMEDMPVTTYSPAAPILRRAEQTTTPSLLTTIIARIPTTIPPRHTFTTTQDYSSFTTTEVPMRETTITPTTPPTAASTTAGSEEPIRELVDQKPFDQDSTDSTEVNLNVLNRTEERMATATVLSSVTTTTTTTTDSTLSSATLTNNVELDDTSAGQGLVGRTGFTTERSEQTTAEDIAIDGGKVPIVVDEKHVYDTVTTTTTMAPIPSTTFAPSTTPNAVPVSSESVSVSSESFTTRRTIDRSMTTTELSEEESITEEDYIELANPSNASDVPGSGVQAGTSAAPKQTEGSTEQSQGEPATEEDNSVVVAVVASIVSVIVVLLLIAAFMYYPPLQIVFRKRQNQVSYGQRCRPVGLDAYSLDNVSVYNSVRRKGNTARMSKRSYGNSAFEDPNFKTNPLTVAELANIIQNKTAIYDEFKEIPNVTARADEVPDGCEDKNRYANVVPLPETRVHLKRLNDDEKTEYINANFVKGPKDSANYYIACQAPMENTINDFWRMIWEQNSKVIIMATDLSENGVEKCAEYLPPSVVLDNSRTFGDFQLTLKNRENKEKYTISTVHMRHVPSNNLREIMHFWYQWPDTGVPIDESSIIGMLLEARSYLKLSPSELAEFATIVEENEKAPPEPTANGTENTHNNNNNSSSNNNGTTTKEPASIVSNGGTMDKHKSLQRTQGPMTVHCSPGTGRTGTLVACDVALRLLEIPPRTVDVPQIVYYVRRGRASAVRTREQYELVYRVANVYATKLTGPTIET
ncbi:serine-rich adhesin for platelets isoform X1 [Anopheles darlingi]|uniref:serine-rich adhesin for platelets isoform X1 n=1 Tax=Anopheles darlingi TaxID=43151 RepID=UPI0021000384|nr:serine-rich adhesin for platelets isoform X1 [Anopheles darlingi]XP_049535604.1 serine-rich adhesin for platelets isoform X1 [Anopheles darlingi]XP_049535605.1 serine-rich adhesin for platelets isoform X1 [Anopheles darlingi]XP_049535606.1 serine-rich adhesin for platelets isoform X1 [Anopheles darlingi]XP_049535607.1 serine-rich adhesin for platelets isoform X1 [Anopheles darlingi]